MSYIGKEPQTGAYSMLDNLTASATASYSLTLDSVAFVPESANHLIVSLNGVIQKAGSSFTVSGSTLTFSSTLASSDSIDFILALGNVLDIGTPSDATVTNAKTNFVSTSSAAGLQIKGDNTTAGTLQLNCEQNSHGIKLRSPAHSASQSYTLTFPTTSPSADKFLKTDGSGNLSFADAGGGVNTPIFQARMGSSQSISNGSTTKVNFDTEVLDTASAYDPSSNYRFTVPSGQAGKYFLHAKITFGDLASTDAAEIIRMYKNGSQVAIGVRRTVGSTGRDGTIAVSQILDLSVSDYIEIYAYTNGGGVTLSNDSAQCVFEGFKLAE